MIRVEFFAGAAMRPHLPSLTRLRGVVFREWPYLYDAPPPKAEGGGETLADRPGAGMAVAFDGDTVVGCSTCMPLAQEEPYVSAPFVARGWDLGRFFYFGESVLLPDYRGKGIGLAFYEQRTAHARAASDSDFATFCAVQRPAMHPLRPPGFVPLDTFWRKRGFTPYPDLVCTMRWKQVDTEDKVENRLAFWIASLTGAPMP